jgi:hypothetical protein
VNALNSQLSASLNEQKGECLKLKGENFHVGGLYNDKSKKLKMTEEQLIATAVEVNKVRNDLVQQEKRFKSAALSHSSEHIRALEGLVAEMGVKRDKLEEEMRNMLAHQQALEGRQRETWRLQLEELLALQNNDWAQRLSLWNRRALAAEAEIERLEERRKPGQGPVLDGFQRLESGSTSRGGTLSASWSRVELSGQLTHLRGDGVLVEDDEDGWLYAKGGEPIAMTWDLVGMILDVAAWGPGRYFYLRSSP